MCKNIGYKTHLRVFNRELEDYFFIGYLAVDTGKGVKFGLNIHLILRIQQYLKSFSTISLETNTLTNNFSRVNNIIKHRVLDSSQSARTRTRTLSTDLPVDILR